MLEVQTGERRRLEGKMSRRALVIEDDSTNLELVVAVLEKDGWIAQAAVSGEAGLRMARTERPDLIIMDIRMPGMTGLEATQLLKADPCTASVPILIVTAQALRGDAERARLAGAEAYLTKPLDLRQFRETVDRLMANPPGGGQDHGL